jgi:hypothetical protein
MADPTLESSSRSESEPKSEEVTYNPVAYDSVTYGSVTIHYRAESEEPLTVKRVIEFADSIFPGSGERALQVIDDPRKGPVGGIFNVELILVPPGEISHITLRKGEEETTATVEEVLGDGSAI